MSSAKQTLLLLCLPIVLSESPVGIQMCCSQMLFPHLPVTSAWLVGGGVRRLIYRLLEVQGIATLITSY